jgi:hypothetical protein
MPGVSRKLGALSPGELDRRRPVWVALSDVFLDTETRWFFPRIARALAESGYEPDELVRIWRREAVPEFGTNLLSIAGEWGALAVDEGSLAARAEGGTSMGGLALQLTVGRALRSHLQALLALRRTLMRHPRGDWLVREKVWTAFAHAYLEPSLSEVLFLSHYSSDLRASGLATAALTEAFESEFRPVYRALVTGEDRATETQRAANVIELIAR